MQKWRDTEVTDRRTAFQLYIVDIYNYTQYQKQCMHACSKTYNFIVYNNCINYPTDLHSIHYINMVPAMIDKPYISKSAAACG